MLRHLRASTPVIAGFVLLSVGIFFGEVWGLYENIRHFDKTLHLLGGIIAAWFVLSIMQKDIVRMRWWKQVVIIVGITALIGVVWEWAEFLGNTTRLSHPTIYRFFHGGDLADTLGDLVADVGGALVLAFWAVREERS